jgi:hypothetical protein
VGADRDLVESPESLPAEGRHEGEHVDHEVEPDFPLYLLGVLPHVEVLLLELALHVADAYSALGLARVGDRKLEVPGLVGLDVDLQDQQPLEEAQLARVLPGQTQLRAVAVYLQQEALHLLVEVLADIGLLAHLDQVLVVLGLFPAHFRVEHLEDRPVLVAVAKHQMNCDNALICTRTSAS